MSSIIGGVDYGPLANFIGVWEGRSGVDRAPKPQGDKTTDFSETITYTAVGDVDNAEVQDLVVVHYHQVVTRIPDGKVYHNQTGYWMWDKGTDEVMFSVSIPRGLCLLANGTYEKGKAIKFKVKAELGDTAYSVVQSKFLLEKAKTEAFEIELTLNENELTYAQTTFLDIYGRKFDHTDTSSLIKKS
ncbi:heme-binding beta-barrel domain-containing protein [Lentisphaera profundi]|uniref:Heme-binding beta-barrel domain-containing protein n=1 Tax=Lentisphaera profundi TaxID=1658616 RepID=A0ABY7VP52_9BACT|nr:heme-binding beta-barrel domain-containing protein [Lentisphaera profundi]WDE95930.1 heme-binding beta-barrel domain-containing protein [Lentisphaera profundi]